MPPRAHVLACLAFLSLLELGCTPSQPTQLGPTAAAKPAASVSASAAPTASPLELDSFAPLENERPRGPAPKIVAIGVGVGGTCAVDDGGQLYCWGHGVPDGNGGIQIALRPVRVAGISDALEVVGNDDGEGFCVLRRSHPLTCWGQGFLEESSSGMMVELPELQPSRAQDLLLGGGWACVISQGRKATCVDSDGPAQIVPPHMFPLQSVVVETGYNVDGHVLIAITSKGVRCEGEGRGIACPYALSGKQLSNLVVPGLRQVSASDGLACALGSRDVLCWGYFVDTQSPRAGSHLSGLDVPRSAPALRGAEQIAVEGDGCVDGRFADGRVVRFFIDPPLEQASSTVIDHGARSIVGGGRHGCALLQDGGVRCWGYSYHGSLGNNATNIVMRPRPIEGITDATRIWTDHGTYVLRANGSVLWYGYRVFGTVEQGTEVSKGSTSDGVTSCPRKEAEWHSVQRGPNGKVRCPNPGFETAVEVVGEAADGASGSKFVCGRFPDNTVRCQGELSLEGKTEKSEKVSYTLDKALVRDAVALRSGPSGVCALLREGGARCFGTEHYWSLGTPRHQPLKLPSKQGVRDIALGKDDACAVDFKGTVYCDKGVSVHEVRGLPPVRSVAAGDGFFCALSELGHVFCWGRNEYGQLGTGGNEPHNGPVQAWGLRHVVELIAQDDAACARTDTGQVYCWGNNVFGVTGQPLAEGSSEAIEPWW